MLISMYQSYCMPGPPKIHAGVPLVVPGALKYQKKKNSKTPKIAKKCPKESNLSYAPTIGV